jgi:hypothetical protein
MNAEFNWWLLIVGLVVGAGLVWLVIADWSRREEDLSEDERVAEAAWIAEVLRERGERVDPAEAEEILALHRAYLRQSGALDASEEADPFPADGTEETEPTDWAATAALDEDDQTASRQDGRGRSVSSRSVRATPLSPRGGGGLESEPPAT